MKTETATERTCPKCGCVYTGDDLIVVFEHHYRKHI